MSLTLRGCYYIYTYIYIKSAKPRHYEEWFSFFSIFVRGKKYIYIVYITLQSKTNKNGIIVTYEYLTEKHYLTILSYLHWKRNACAHTTQTVQLCTLTHPRPLPYKYIKIYHVRNVNPFCLISAYEKWVEITSSYFRWDPVPAWNSGIVCPYDGQVKASRVLISA